MEKTKGLKVTLIGESGVGKTAIISRLCKGIFTESQLSTIGGSYEEKKIFIKEKNREISLEIWDTAGQEKLRALNKIFYRKAVACVLVYDISKLDSFTQLKDYWYKEVKKNTSEKTSIFIYYIYSYLYCWK